MRKVRPVQVLWVGVVVASAVVVAGCDDARVEVPTPAPQVEREASPPPEPLVEGAKGAKEAVGAVGAVGLDWRAVRFAEAGFGVKVPAAPVHVELPDKPVTIYVAKLEEPSITLIASYNPSGVQLRNQASHERVLRASVRAMGERAGVPLEENLDFVQREGTTAVLAQGINPQTGRRMRVLGLMANLMIYIIHVDYEDTPEAGEVAARFIDSFHLLPEGPTLVDVPEDLDPHEHFTDREVMERSGLVEMRAVDPALRLGGVPGRASLWRGEFIHPPISGEQRARARRVYDVLTPWHGQFWADFADYEWDLRVLAPDRRDAVLGVQEHLAGAWVELRAHWEGREKLEQFEVLQALLAAARNPPGRAREMIHPAWLSREELDTLLADYYQRYPSALEETGVVQN